jgi:pimeloyl-ACP methyl ester carboxylesterase
VKRKSKNKALTALKWLGLALAGLVLAIVLALLLFRLAASWRESDEARPPESRMVPTSFGRVAVQMAGPADGPPIVLIHGAAGWSGFWRDVTAHLAARGWRVIAVDLPPFGYSEHDPQERYDRISQAQRLAEVLQRTARRPAVVVGHSFGAGSVVELALRTPQRVRALVLVDAALGGLDPPPAEPRLIDWTLGQGWIARPVTSASLTNPLATGALLRSMLARKEAADAWLDTIRQPMRRSGTTRAYAAWLPSLFAADDGALSRRSANLRRIAVPVSIIWGAADTVTPIAQGEALARLTRARRFARLPGVGHIPHIEDPAGFLAALDAATAGDLGGR